MTLNLRVFFTFAVALITKSTCFEVLGKQAGSTIVLSCNSEQYRTVSISGKHVWWFNEQVILTGPFKPMDIGLNNVNGTIYNETFSYLQIHDFSTFNEGYYECTIGENVAASFDLKIAGQMVVKFVSQGMDVLLTCSLRGAHIWKFNDAIIVADRFQPSDIGLTNVHFKLVSNSSSHLHINNTMFSNAGNYSCTVAGENSEVKYSIIFQDVQLHLLIGGHNISDRHFLIADVTYKITCAIFGNVYNREYYITLMNFRRSTLRSFMDSVPEIVRGSNEVTMNVTFERNTFESVFMCIAKDEYSNDVDNKTHKLEIFVVPALVIQMEGRNMSDRYYAYVGEVLVLSCLAIGSRPPVELHWKRGGVNVSDTVTVAKPNKFKQFKNDTEARYSIGVEQSVVLTCYSSGLSESHKREVNLIVEVRRLTEFRHIMILGGVSVTVILIVSTLFYTRLRLQRKKRENAELFALSVWQDATCPDSNGEISNVTPVSLATLDSSSDHGKNTETDAYMHSNVTSNEYVASCEAVQVMTLLHGGESIDYWLGRYSSTNGDTDCVCEKVSDNAQMKDGYNFLTLVKSLRSLPSHSNIVSFLGSSTDEMPYYLYREYVERGTLRDFLLQNYNLNRSSDVFHNALGVENKPHPIMFAGDVAYAMEFLHFYQFHHPALSARKVLVSNSLVCKVFDFWPTELSTERAATLMKSITRRLLSATIKFLQSGKDVMECNELMKVKRESNPPTAWFPPETLFMDQYNTPSDVWSYGTLLWEIFSLGETPHQFKNPKEIEDDIRNMKLPPQPQNCPGAVFSIMLSSWKKYPYSRPSFTEIKDQIKSLQESFETNVQTTDNEWNLDYFTLENEDYPAVQYSQPAKY